MAALSHRVQPGPTAPLTSVAPVKPASCFVDPGHAQGTPPTGSRRIRRATVMRWTSSGPS
jgi:hypothetical protein